MEDSTPGSQQGRQCRLLRVIRAAGPLVAWLGAAACGWKVYSQSDLLEAVLRGTAAWLGVLVIWTGGATVCERLLESDE